MRSEYNSGARTQLPHPTTRTRASAMAAPVPGPSLPTARTIQVETKGAVILDEESPEVRARLPGAERTTRLAPVSLFNF